MYPRYEIFFNGKPGHRGPTHPILMENSINFFLLRQNSTYLGVTINDLKGPLFSLKGVP